MKKNIFCLSLLILAGCVPTTHDVFWRENASPNRRQNDYTDCQVEAVNRVPASTQIGVTPTYVTPVSTTCYGSGYSTYCSSTGGQIYGGNVYSYDANAGVRANVMQQCMARRGYQLISFPSCTTAQQEIGVIPRGTNPLPPASSILCLTDTGWVLNES